MRIAFYQEVGRLKSLPRKGWVRRDIPYPETVAAHMYRSQFIAYDLAKELGEDPVACAHMMMIHDLPEAHAGDITPHDGISPAEKAALEIQSAKGLALLSGNSEFLTLFIEYEQKETLRAQICNDADKLECLVQALEYQRLYPEKKAVLADFWPYAQERLMTDPGKRMFAELWEQKRHLGLSNPTATMSMQPV